MNILIIINCLCSISIVIASFYCIVRARFSDHFISSYGGSLRSWKYIAIVGVLLGYSISMIDLRLIGSDFRVIPHSWKMIYLCLTIGFALMNLLCWRVMLHSRSASLAVAKIGGRPRRKKKPTYRVSGNIFHFEGLEETMASRAFLFNHEYSDYEITILDIVNIASETPLQRIEFSQIIAGELDEITIEFE